MRLVRFVSCIAIFSLTTGRAPAQKGPAPFPPKNLWIVACVNGGTPKSKKSFQPLVRLLRAAYAIPPADTNSLFVFLPDLTGLIREKADRPEADLSSTPIITSANDDTLAASLAVQYSGATVTKLNRKWGIIYPHLLVKTLFTAYTDQAYPPYTFDTIRTFVFSSQNNIYFESSRENVRTIEQNKKDFKKRLGDWYSILDNKAEDCYLRKTLTRKTGDLLYVKISQLMATDIPGQLDAADFTRFIKSKTTITHYRDSVHVTIRFGKSFRAIPIMDMQYAYTNRGSKTFVPAVDVIRFDGDYAVPDSIRLNASFLIRDPLLGKKLIHRSYTMAFPPKAGLIDHIIIYKWLWLGGGLLLVGLVLFLIWAIRRQKELRIYKTGFYGLFKDIAEDEQRLPNKIQLLLFGFSGTEPAYLVLQPGHRKAAVQAFLFEGKKLVITAKDKIYKQSPFLISGEAPAVTLSVQVLRTSIWKLARLHKGQGSVNWMEVISRAPAASFTIDCSKVRMDMLLTAGTKKPAGHLYFSRSHPFPQLPAYYHHKTEAVVVATEAINEWIEKSGLYPVGPCHIVVKMPGQRLGLLYVHFLEPARVQIELFDLLHTDQTPETALDDLLEGFLAHNSRCPVLLAGAGPSTGIAFGLPPHKDRVKQVISAFKTLPETINQPGLDIIKEMAPDPGVFTFTFKPDKMGTAEPVFTWQAAAYPLKLALEKKIGLKGKTWTIATRPLPLTPEGTLTVKLVMRKGIAYSLYLSPCIHPLYLRQINPVERFSFPKKISVTMELDLPGRQLLINEKSYDIRL